VKIVYIASIIPYPPNSGHRIRNYNLLRCIGQSNELHVFILSPDVPSPEDMNALGEFCKTIQWFQEAESEALSQPWMAVSYLFRGMPPEYRLSYSAEMWKALVQFFNRNQSGGCHSD